MKLKILLADDHSLMRMGLASLIAVEKDMKVVGEASDGDEAVALAKRLKPDVIIMDLMMPKLGGASATEAILKTYPAAKILILTSGYSAFTRRATRFTNSSWSPASPPSFRPPFASYFAATALHRSHRHISGAASICVKS